MKSLISCYKQVCILPNTSLATLSGTCGQYCTPSTPPYPPPPAFCTFCTIPAHISLHSSVGTKTQSVCIIDDGYILDQIY